MTIELKKIHGWRDMERMLKALPDKMAVKVMPSAVRASTKPVIKAAKARVPVETGLLKRTIRYSRAKTKRGMVKYIVGPIKRKGGRDPFYWVWVEYGSKLTMGPQRPFLRSAFDAKVDETIGAMRHAMFKEIEKQKNKLTDGFLK